MVLDAKINSAREALGIQSLNDWTQIRPEQITAIHGCGPQTRDHIRLFLAGHGLTLRDDGTPAYWQASLGQAKIGAQLSDQDRCAVLPFTILIDAMEQIPFTFQGFHEDASENARPLLVPTRVKALGPTHGDYSIDGMEGEAHVERKSVDDAIGTFLEHGERRERWQRTLEFLASIPTAAVVIEGSIACCLSEIRARGKRSQKVLRRTFLNQVLAWEQDWRIPFVFCDMPRLAEAATLQIFRRHFRHRQSESTVSAKTELDKSRVQMIAEL